VIFANLVTYEVLHGQRRYVTMTIKIINPNMLKNTTNGLTK